MDLFADDTMIVVKDKNINAAIAKIDCDLQKILNWLNKNKLSLNMKTKWMAISRGTIQENLDQVKIENEVIERVHHIKYLGTTIDDKLSFEKHFNTCVKKVAGKTNLLSRVSRKLTFEAKKTVYNTIVLPHFQYCSTVYFTCTKEQIQKMQKIQNRAMRIILKCDYLTPRDFMLKALNWLSIHQQIKYNVLVFIYKTLKGHLPKYLSENLTHTSNIHDRNTRQNDNDILRLPNFKLESSRKNIFYYGIKLYNEMPKEIKEKESLNGFKTVCRKYVMDKYEII